MPGTIRNLVRRRDAHHSRGGPAGYSGGGCSLSHVNPAGINWASSRGTAAAVFRSRVLRR